MKNGQIGFLRSDRFVNLGNFILHYYKNKSRSLNKFLFAEKVLTFSITGKSYKDEKKLLSRINVRTELNFPRSFPVLN